MTHQEQTQTILVQRGAPRHKAEAKAASLARGVVFLVVGFVLMVMAAALVGVPMVLLREIPGVAFLVFAGIFGAIGALMVFAGGHIMSGEALDAAAETGSMVAKVAARSVKMIRAK